MKSIPGKGEFTSSTPILSSFKHHNPTSVCSSMSEVDGSSGTATPSSISPSVSSTQNAHLSSSPPQPSSLSLRLCLNPNLGIWDLGLESDPNWDNLFFC
ncbi:hypothetical protein Pyn_14964 [Prunus yedoensis var. nudiflora]|uniref:Uncharacterized protein n=1 Tax=Prunus yedoensis var. nudiflora TaxID=2094558 RepID=A0A314ZNN1_PRUYE|nr:hypothetical protein Pyn_14964 [Prunus yedoensis var. nudiflora]